MGTLAGLNGYTAEETAVITQFSEAVRDAHQAITTAWHHNKEDLPKLMHADGMHLVVGVEWTGEGKDFLSFHPYVIFL